MHAYTTTNTRVEIPAATADAKAINPQFKAFYCVGDVVVSYEQYFTPESNDKPKYDWRAEIAPENCTILHSFPFRETSISSSSLNLNSCRQIKEASRSIMPIRRAPKRTITEYPIFEIRLTDADCFLLNIPFDTTHIANAKDEKFSVSARLLSPTLATLKPPSYYNQPIISPDIHYSFQDRKEIENELQQTWEAAPGKIYTKLRKLILKLPKQDLNEHEQKLLNEIDFELVQIGSKPHSTTQLINLFDAFYQRRESAARPLLSWIFSPSYHSIHYQAFLYVASFNLNAHLKFSELQTKIDKYIPVDPLISIIEDYLFFSPASFRKHKLNDPSKKPQSPQKVTQSTDEKSATAVQPATAPFCKRKFNDLPDQSEPPLKITKASDEEPAPAAVLRS